MTGEDRVALVARFLATFDRALLAPDCDWRVSPGYPVPRRTWCGPDDVFDAFFPALRRHYRTWQAQVATLLPLPGDGVFAAGAYHATGTGGTPAVIPFMHRWTVRADRIAAVEAVADFPPA